MSWPSLREEIDLLPGPRLSDGQPSWTLHDPVRNRFFAIDWPSFEILKRLSYADADKIATLISNDTTLALNPTDVSNFAQFLSENQLVQTGGLGSAKKFADRLAKMQGSPVKWLIHHYLFFRVPLWNPDAWLQRWMSVAEFFFTSRFALLSLSAFCIGLFQIGRQWDVFVSSLVDMFTWSGLITYGVAIILVKWLHELGHAFAARRLGCRVPAMGVAFLVMFPMAYTDTNETWRLTRNKQRLQIASAGILIELAIAAWATLAWALLPDGDLRSIAFVLATTSLIATLVINSSPFLRFDGYFILSDLIDMPNLHQRSFALARWKLREWLFGLCEEKPEVFRKGKERALIFFAWLTWLYRLVVFIGIALLIYGFFLKLLGVILFVVELAWFIAMPIKSELMEWRKRWPTISRSRRSKMTATIVVLLTALFMLPWPTRVTSSGVLQPAEVWRIYAPGPALFEAEELSGEGARFEVDDVVMRLVSPELEARQDMLTAKLESLQLQSNRSGFNSESVKRMQSLREQVVAAQTELAEINTQLEQYSLKAPFTGFLRDIGFEISSGQWVGPDELLGLLVNEDSRSQVITYLDESDVERIKLGYSGIFLSDGRENGALALTVTRIDSDATRQLTEGILAAHAGGDILVREQEGQLIPERAIYRVTLALDENETVFYRQILRGDVVIRAEWQSPLLPYLKNALAVLVREFGF